MPRIGLVVLLALIGSASSSSSSSEEQRETDGRQPRFGFGLLNPIRRMFCETFCTDPEDAAYIANLACAVKCPELYLPHGSTTRPSVSVTWTAIPMTTTTTSTTTIGTDTASPGSSTTPSSSSPSSSSSSSSSSTTATGDMSSSTTAMTMAPAGQR